MSRRIGVVTVGIGLLVVGLAAAAWLAYDAHRAFQPIPVGTLADVHALLPIDFPAGTRLEGAMRSEPAAPDLAVVVKVSMPEAELPAFLSSGLGCATLEPGDGTLLQLAGRPGMRWWDPGRVKGQVGRVPLRRNGSKDATEWIDLLVTKSSGRATVYLAAHYQ